MNDELRKRLFEGIKEVIIDTLSDYDDLVINILEQTDGVDDDNWYECGHTVNIMLHQLTDKIKELLEQIKNNA